MKMVVEPTTELDKLQAGTPFVWGEMVTIQTIGPYSIGAFRPWKSDKFSVSVGEPDRWKIHFHIWVDGKDTLRASETLDEAIAEAIAYRREGLNSHAAVYFIRGMRAVHGLREWRPKGKK